MKNNGDNLIFGGEDKCEEWPCVGDEVVLYGRPCMVIGVDGDVYWIKKESGSYNIASRNQLQKPKTPEEELRDELKEIINTAMRDPLGLLNDGNDKLVDYMLAKYNITKKPQ